MLDDFSVFILSHGRPDNVDTYKTLKRCGYTGKVYIVIDNEDKTAKQYHENFGDKVIVFDKAAIAETFDEGDNFGDRRAVVYARNACFNIAKEIGVTYFMELDDDYTQFRYRSDSNSEYTTKGFIYNLDRMMDGYLNYFKSIQAKSIAMGQGGDFIGGRDNGIFTSLGKRRKCMNTFICSTERYFNFVGRINEDVNTYTWYQSLGNLFMTIPLIAVEQRETQHNDGGMTDLYLDSGTYVKSFYTVMFAPSCTKIGLMGDTHKRLHHQIKWDHAVPKIMSESYRKQKATQ